jgi:hypothetical protein
MKNKANIWLLKSAFGIGWVFDQESFLTAKNQVEVAELVAQDPVQSADLENTGIRVKMDSEGKVTLAKINGDMDKIMGQTEYDDTS